MEFEMVEKMTVVELKSYLRLRDLKMVARVFAAIENILPIKKAAEEVESQLLDEYQAKLLLEEIIIPDPNYLVSRWLSENDGIGFYPRVLYADIFSVQAK